MQIDWFPILFDAQLVVIVVMLVILVFDDKIKAWEQKMIRNIRKKKNGIRCTDGKIVGMKEIPTVQAEKVIELCRNK